MFYRIDRGLTQQSGDHDRANDLVPLFKRLPDQGQSNGFSTIQRLGGISAAFAPLWHKPWLCKRFNIAVAVPVRIFDMAATMAVTLLASFVYPIFEVGKHLVCPGSVAAPFEVIRYGRTRNGCPLGCDTSKIGPPIHEKMEWSCASELADLIEYKVDRPASLARHLLGTKEMQPTAFRIGWNFR